MTVCHSYIGCPSYNVIFPCVELKLLELRRYSLMERGDITGEVSFFLWFQISSCSFICMYVVLNYFECYYDMYFQLYFLNPRCYIQMRNLYL